jgi:WXXGXW repeat (2 copies)
MERDAIGALNKYQKLAQSIGVTPPLLVGLTLTGVKGWKVQRGPYDFGKDDAVFDREVVAAPEVMLSDLATPADIVLHPLLDFVWNGGGWSGSPNYHDGRWVKPRS